MLSTERVRAIRIRAVQHFTRGGELAHLIDKAGKRKHHKPRLPDHSPWPPRGFVTVTQMMAALGVRSPQTVYSYVRQGLLPEPSPIGPNRIGWPVAAAGEAVDSLPEKVRRNGTGLTLTARRIGGAE